LQWQGRSSSCSGRAEVAVAVAAAGQEVAVAVAAAVRKSTVYSQQY